MRVIFIVVVLCCSQLAHGTLDPQGCDLLSDSELRAIGYEPVRAFGAVGDGVADDTEAIQAAINTAYAQFKSVYFHPGDYLVTDTIQVRQKDFDTSDSEERKRRYGITLQGSYCGDEKPIIRFPDNLGDAPFNDAHARETVESRLRANPKPVLLLLRDNESDTDGDPSRNNDPADGTDGSRDFNQLVRNLHIITGQNSGVVGLRHNGAEGSAAQEIKITATGGFAGMYSVNSSGGYTHGIEIIGGKHGLFVPQARGGATLMMGLTLREQESTPIVFDHFAPLVIVGADIQHGANGNVISSLSGNEFGNGLDSSFTISGSLLANQNSGGHLNLIDSQIEILNNSNLDTNATISNTSRSVYLSNVYFKGEDRVLNNISSNGGDLRVANGDDWFLVDEYVYSGDFLNAHGEYGKNINGEATDGTFYKQVITDREEDILVTQIESPPVDLLSQHLFPLALCNAEGAGVEFVVDYGADPNDPADDSAAIQAAIDAASAGSKRVFLSSGDMIQIGEGNFINEYSISNTLVLKSGVRLCGVSRSATILSARGWLPDQPAPVIATENGSIDADTMIADFGIYTPAPARVSAPATSDFAYEYSPAVFSLLWKAGRNSVVRDVDWAFDKDNDPGDRISVIIEGDGGGKWYGLNQYGGRPPHTQNGARPTRSRLAIL